MRRALLIGLGWALVGCGSAATTAGTAVPALRDTSSSASQSATGDLRTTAAAAYQALADHFKPIATALGAQFDKDAQDNDLTSAASDFTRFASANQDFLVGLEQISFPASMQQDVKALIRSVTAEIDALQYAGSSTDTVQLRARVPSFVSAAQTASGDANVIRADLGLPPAS